MTREDLICLANVAQETARFDDVVKVMKEVAKERKGLSRDEATLFSLGYKEKLSSCRNAWRKITEFESKGNETLSRIPERLIQYRREIEQEIETICNEVIQLIEADILPFVEGAESKAFFIKMKADYFRYLAEIAQDTQFDNVVQGALEAYMEASKLAEEGLPEGHPVRLGIALNFSVFHFEALNDPAKACELAQAAINTPEEALDALPEDQRSDSASMIELLKGNLRLWTEQGDDEEAES